MDPIAHTFTGAALAAAGLRRVTPLATAALVIGANAPDVDVVMNFAGDYAALAHRRGWTHGLLAIVVLPLVVTAALMIWDRTVRRRGRPDAPPARAGPLLALSALAVLTHPALDWLNNYGMRWLMPFDGRWFYGDALFIVDPWVWLVLGGVVFLAHSRRGRSLGLWGTFWLLGTALVLVTPVPMLARAVWIAGLGALIGLRAAGITADTRPLAIERAARAALVVISVYMGATALANIPARTEVTRTLAGLGIGPIEHVMIGPTPADPLGGTVVAETATAYYTGRWHWLASPRFEPSAKPIPKLPRTPVIAAALETVEAKRYLTWSRFPYFEVESADAGHVVRIGDVRYEGTGRLAGPEVRLDAALQPIRPQ